MLSQFESYPFEKLRTFLSNSTPPQDSEIFTLTIGEPQFPTPQNILESLQHNAPLLNKYPKSSGESYLKDAQLSFIKQRYNISLTQEQIIPTFGTREVLFNFPQFYLYGKANPTIAYPNPFYQIYEGAALASKAKVIYMNLAKENDFTPHLTESQLKEVDIVILNSPNNPTGKAMDMPSLIQWVENALRYDFVILSDECYSEIYSNSPPPSILEASIQANNKSFKNIIALNSISKRSCAPGLRSGFVAGDSEILKAYNLYRTYLGCALPLPLQKAATTAWQDMQSPESSRKIYAKNLALAQEILYQWLLDRDCKIYPYTFYVWLEVGDDEAFCKFAYEKCGVLTLPGSYLGRENQGRGYVRIALVYDNDTTQKALLKLREALILYKTLDKKEQE
ncbi:succinyldiaminopimelate transaminase [Helicobacter cinaedi]|uniref:Aminotransferase n=1 Tax=Helicobacter cinaedi CCUG 18818 = ATCC BAA-847 TaxID=537971 RepID=A0AAI8MNS3_9HELI|nr:succinyldiaminopimelate transaminase [Helicobacter cinaedi]EFR45599.1 aminotransferase, class I/II [Helicobacter cinaedi CCUG 18818 = ATCC BAA-847]QOQ91098.1 succinyldiaminopimelate transaminase [Helicobacter cinaedi]BAM32973.1 aminotransferase [Helicobacter cinaedi CCUG 18818 = ATCC BAA-847]